MTSRRFTAVDLARLAAVPLPLVRRCIRAKVLSPCLAEGARRFGFRHVREVRELAELLSEVRPSERAEVLKRFHAQPAGVEIEYGRVVVQDPRGRWEASTGQGLLPLSISEPEAQTDNVLAFQNPATDTAKLADALAKEASQPSVAERIYRDLLERQASTKLEAAINLGRLLANQHRDEEAEHMYELALDVDPNCTIAWFNLGVLRQQQHAFAEAAAQYRRVIELDPQFADAHYNLSQVCEQLGQPLDALRHFKVYRRLSRGEP